MPKHNLISNQFCENGKNIKMNASNIYWILIWHKMNPSNRGLPLLLPSLFSCAPMMQDWSHNLSAVKYEGRPMNFYRQEPRGLIVASIMHKCNIGRLRCQPKVFNPFNETFFKSRNLAMSKLICGTSIGQTANISMIGRWKLWPL